MQVSNRYVSSCKSSSWTAARICATARQTEAGIHLGCRRPGCRALLLGMQGGGASGRQLGSLALRMIPVAGRDVGWFGRGQRHGTVCMQNQMGTDAMVWWRGQVQPPAVPHGGGGTDTAGAMPVTHCRPCSAHQARRLSSWVP